MKTQTQEQVADSIQQAHDYLESIGWCQRALAVENDKGDRAVCMVGALRWTVHGDQIYGVIPQAGCTTYEAQLVWAVRESIGITQVMALSSWNDQPYRAKWEVLEELQTAAKRVRHGDIEVPDYSVMMIS